METIKKIIIDKSDDTDPETVLAPV